MSKPSILLIPGSFALPEFYNPVFDAITAKGYEIKGLHLPSVGPSALKAREGIPPPTMYDDAAFIAKEAEILADQGKDVIVIGHSYGGVPVTQSIKGLGKEERKKVGKAGGVVNLAYITSLVPALGVSAAGVLADVPKEQEVVLTQDGTGWMYHADPAGTARITLNHLPLSEGEAWIKLFPKHSSVSFINELTYAGYNDVPVSYLLCEEDLCIPPAVQRAGIEMMEKESGRKVHVTSIGADHCPNVTSLQETLDWILDVARRVEDGQV